MATKSKPPLLPAAGTLPPRFQSYSEQDVGGDSVCLVGASTDEDGMNKRAVAVLATRGERSVSWARHLDGLEEAYQSRATHCVGTGDAVYALLQSDTHAAQTLSQTVLTVVRLSVEGAIQALAHLNIPAAVDRACSAYVHDTSDAFRWDGDVLAVEGTYYLLSDPDQRMPFALRLRPDLSH